MKNNDINLVATQFADNYKRRVVLDKEMAAQKTHLVDYATAHPHAFVGKRLSLGGGVYVQRSVRQQVRFDRAKMTPEWLQRMEAAGNGSAVELRIDPRKLTNNDTTALLLQEVAYTVDSKETMSVALRA